MWITLPPTTFVKIWYNVSDCFFEIGDVKLSQKVMLNENNTIWVHEFNKERFDYFLGRILTLVETLGLPETQEKAFKDIIKQEIWSLWENPWGVEEKTRMLDGEVAEGK